MTSIPPFSPDTDLSDEVFQSVNIRVESPDGTMFVTIMENEAGFPFKILIHIGKSGSSLSAWSECVAELMSEALPRLGVNGIIAKLLGIHSDKVSLVRDTVTNEGNHTVRSGPEAIAHALIKYRTDKHRQFMKSLGIPEDDDLEDHFRPANSA